jgi:hypothetical protein
MTSFLKKNQAIPKYAARSIHTYRDPGADLFKHAGNPNAWKIKYASDKDLKDKLSEETGVPRHKIDFFLSTSKELVHPKDPQYMQWREFGGRKKGEKMRSIKRKKGRRYSRSRLGRSGQRR